RSVNCTARRTPEVIVDHAHVLEATSTRKLDKPVLTSLAFAILLDLESRGLSHINDSSTLDNLLRQLTHLHRAPRFPRLRGRPEGACCRDERSPSTVPLVQYRS